MKPDDRYQYEPYVRKAAENAPLRYERLERNKPRSVTTLIGFGVLAALLFVFRTEMKNRPYLLVPAGVAGAVLFVVDHRHSKLEKKGFIEFREEAVCIVDVKGEAAHRFPVSQLRNVQTSFVRAEGDNPPRERERLVITLMDESTHTFECLKEPFHTAYHEPLNVMLDILRREIPRRGVTEQHLS